jgi:tetratricopeptide (TPR) repeat protein
MKVISKITNIALGLVFIGSAVSGQSLADAKKAIDAEQYQKATGMLKNLTTTQPNDENHFYLGWVYLIQDYADSAKAAFTKGLAAEPKSAISYVGLGAVALSTNDATGATSNFNQAIQLAKKKDGMPYLYIGKAYLLDAKDGKFPPAKANAAIDALTKGKTVDPKDADIMVTLGNAYRSQLKSNDAYDAYQAALTLDPKSPTANVATGVLWRYANNFDDSEKQFQAALAIDPNFGPAYRELAETQKTLALRDRAVASAKIKEAVENYKKFLSLTDESVESLLRYADFLVNAGEYSTLQEVATKLSKSAAVNARIYRYLGYAAYENKDYTAAQTALDNWFSKASADRILPRDYLYLGRIQIAKADTVKGVENLRKAAELDSTKNVEIYNEIASLYRGSRKNYPLAAKTYNELIEKNPGKPLLTEHLYAGIYSYFSFDPKAPDSTILVKADSAMRHVIRIATKPVPEAYIYLARIADLKDNSADLSQSLGKAKPHYEKFIEVFAPDAANLSAANKRALAESYAYLAGYALYHDKDDAKAMEQFTKAREIDPNNAQAKFYFDNKNAPAPAAKPAAKKAGTK